MSKPYLHDKLIPIHGRTSKISTRATPNFADIVQVNAILEKRSLKNKNIADTSGNEHFITLASLRNKNTKYDNLKQEQYHRLERRGKIQENSEWMELIKNVDITNNKKINISKAKTCFQQIKETNRQIDQANKELDCINSAINKRRSLPLNKITPTSATKIVQPSNSIGNKNKMLTNNHRKHLCGKGLYPENISDVNTMMSSNKKPMDDNKLFEINSSYMKTKSKPSNRKLNAIRNKRVDATISLLDEKLKKVNGKYFNSDYEHHLKTLVQRKPKYRSVKDLLRGETDKMRLETMEASKIIQNEIDKDVNSPRNKAREFSYQTQVLYENLDFLDSQVFQDNFSDEEKNDIKDRHTPTIIRSPSSHSPRKFADKNQLHPKYKPPLSGFKTAQKLPLSKKEHITNSTKETMTHKPLPNNKLEAAILKSDYLRKEFNLNMPEISMYGPKFSKPETKFAKQSWSRDVEYLMK